MTQHLDDDEKNWLNEYDDVDVTKRLAKMSAHTLMALSEQVPLSLKGKDINFLFEMLLRIRKAMMMSLTSDETLSQSDRAEAISIMEHSEVVYDAIIAQLKVSRANMDMMN